MALDIIILAAGLGKRLRSSVPKGLHLLAGIPLLEHVVTSVKQLSDRIHVVIGHGSDQIRDHLSHLPCRFIEQTQRLGTGHATRMAVDALPADADKVLILYVDVPAILPATLKRLIASTPANALGFITTRVADPTGMGRVCRNTQGAVIDIIEEKDATAAQKRIEEINSGIYLASVQQLRAWLAQLDNHNASGEYYLTDIVKMAVMQAIPIHSQYAEPEEVQGVNDRQQLAQLERVMQQRHVKRLFAQGVTLRDPARFDQRGYLTVGLDVIIDVNVIIEGSCQIGDRCNIGPNVHLKDVKMADDVVIRDQCVIEGAVIGQGCQIGPFARIRPASHIGPGSRVGNFVEMKNARLAHDSKANHLAYLGDVTMGSGVNIGAGTITCNYDGSNKHQTIIEDNVFVGSNTSLVAPLVLEKNATIGAHSVITNTAPSDKLTLSRTRQKTVDHWQRPEKIEDDKKEV